MEKALKALQE
jgi:hypothetical protein